jgi:uncharacterized protein
MTRAEDSLLKDQLKLLVELQEIDDQIDRHEHNLASLPAQVQEIARELVTLRRDIDEATEQAATTEAELRNKEREMAAEQEKIKRSEKRLLHIKNQKEYNALSREVKLGKRVVGEIEDAVLQLMTKLEALKSDGAKKQELCDTMDKDLVKKKREAEKTSVAAEKALAGLNSEKAKITQGIDRDFLKKYNTIKNARGNAVAEVNGTICSACHMSVPPQLGIRVLKQEEILDCPNCQRILYVKPENIPEYNKIE